MSFLWKVDFSFLFINSVRFMTGVLLLLLTSITYGVPELEARSETIQLTEEQISMAGDLESRAEGGDLEAMVILIDRYDGGYSRSDGQLYWHERAALAGRVESMLELGDVYNRGEVLRRDRLKAAQWYKMAGERGDLTAQAILGHLYLSDRDGGLKRDDCQARFWLEKAAAQAAIGEDDTDLNTRQRAREREKRAKQSVELLKKINQEGLCLNGRKTLSPEDEAAEAWIQDLKVRAHRGEATALKELIRRYVRGLGVDQDWDRALELHQRATGSIDPEFLYYLAVSSERGDNAYPDFCLTLEWYQRAAEAGHHLAIYKVGVMFENGLCVNADLEKAKVYYCQAMELGDLEAQRRLEILDEEPAQAGWAEGFPVSRFYTDRTRSQVEWKYQQKNPPKIPTEAELMELETLARKNDSESWLKLASKYLNMDFTQAFIYWEKAAHAGSGEGAFNLSKAYHQSLGVGGNWLKAKYWLLRAAELGDETAEKSIEREYLRHEGSIPKNDCRAFRFYSRASEEGIPEAQYWLGLIYEKGGCGQLDPARARELFESAAAGGDTWAQFHLQRD